MNHPPTAVGGIYWQGESAYVAKLFALCSLPFALCPLPFALCSLLFAEYRDLHPEEKALHWLAGGAGDGTPI